MLLEHAMSNTFGPATSQPHFFSSKCCSASRPEMARARKEGSFSHLMLAFVHSLSFRASKHSMLAKPTFVRKSCDFRAGAARVHFAHCFRTPKLRFSSPSCQSTLRVLLSYLKVAIFYFFRTEKLRFSNPSCQSTLRVLLSYSKIAIFEPELPEHTSRTTFVLKSCDFRARAAQSTLRVLLS